MSDYFLRNEGGKVIAYELGAGKAINTAAIVPFIQGAKRIHFDFNSRSFKFSVFAAQNALITTIECPLIKWPMPIKFDNGKQSFKLNANSKVVDVFVKDMVFILVDRMEGGHTMYTCYKNGNIPKLTNIHPGGDICLPMSIATMTHPSAIIAGMENSPGNMDMGNENWLDIRIEGENAVLQGQPTNGNKLPKDIEQYTKDYVYS
tara:strand:- start:18198 stop:18809 length:612 start_codon:yes stop_codon:yes gene_type:complete